MPLINCTTRRITGREWYSPSANYHPCILILIDMKKILNKMESLWAAMEEEIEKRTNTFDNRSEKWQESEKGEEFQEKTDRMQEMLDELIDWVEEFEL